jgi:hypothetical protein
MIPYTVRRAIILGAASLSQVPSWRERLYLDSLTKYSLVSRWRTTALSRTGMSDGFFTLIRQPRQMDTANEAAGCPLAPVASLSPAVFDC